MEPTDILSTVAELSVAFAGFSGIVTALRTRADGRLHPEDRVRMTALLGASLSTGAFALLPIALWELAGSASRVWAICSAVYLLYGVIVVVVAERNARAAVAADPTLLERASPWPQRLSTWLGFPLAIALQLANVASWQRFTPYLIALIWGLVGCAIGFVGLVRSLQR